MSWGSQYWGSESWGGTAASSVSRLLYFLRESPNFRKIAEIVDLHFYQFVGIVAQIRGSLHKDVATGDALDKVGSWLITSREGLTDARFLDAINTLIAAVLASPGTADALIDTWTAWVGTAPTYETLPPAGVRLTGIVATADEPTLRKFLEIAKPAGVSLTASSTPTSPVLLADCAQSAVTSPGVIDCAQSAVIGAATIASEIAP